MKLCMHCYVSGRVQGVWYRATTQEKARELQVTGWVKNISDGRVELIACGEQSNVQALIEWLWQGPPAASVTNVVREEIAWQSFNDFEA